ncbi:MAG: 6-phospho-3-hexuloisomerase, partial [Oscillospiraceae bacterium]|nr:6-phospho-3-hexuloisomerase [Oscillospiraceae bacterium]
DIVVALPGVSPKLRNAGMNISSIQPMGSAFEQLSFLTYDGVILELMEKMDESTDTMFPRHADLE